MFCRSCGKKLSDNALFCTVCGTSCSNIGIYPQGQQVIPGQMAANTPDSIDADNNGSKKKKGAFIVALVIGIVVVLIGLGFAGFAILSGEIDINKLFGNKEQVNIESVDDDEANDDKVFPDEKEDSGSIIIETDYAQWTYDALCDNYSDYAFAMDVPAQEIITPLFETYCSSIFVSTVFEFEGNGQYYIDKSRTFDVKLYDATTDTFVGFYTGMYDNIEGGVEFQTREGHSYYLKIATYIEDGEKIHGHGHVYFD